MNFPCPRCGGCMVQERAHIPVYAGSEDEVYLYKCIQCGEAIDSVILRNRQIQQSGGSIDPGKERHTKYKKGGK